MTKRTQRTPHVAEIRARCRASFVELLDRPDFQALVQRTLKDPKHARKYPHLAAGVRRYRPELLPDDTLTVCPAAVDT